MLVLGFESSCDETGVALYDTENGLLAHALHSQVEMHAEFGGVVPELASRDHIRRALPLTELVLKNANKTLKDRLIKQPTGIILITTESLEPPTLESALS